MCKQGTMMMTMICICLCASISTLETKRKLNLGAYTKAAVTMPNGTYRHWYNPHVWHFMNYNIPNHGRRRCLQLGRWQEKSCSSPSRTKVDCLYAAVNEKKIIKEWDNTTFTGGGKRSPWPVAVERETEGDYLGRCRWRIVAMLLVEERHGCQHAMQNRSVND